MSVYKSITKGLKEAIEYEKSAIKARNTKISVEPLMNFDKAEIKTIRSNAKMTQVVFAKFLGVSPKTVEAWEAGRNMPVGPARRMLSMLKQDPEIPEKYRFIEREGAKLP
jgi:putative transcriptional regulator